MDLNLMAEEEEGAREGHAMDLNLMAEEEEGAREAHAIDLNLMAEEEEGAREAHAIDLKLIAEEEEGARHEEEGARHGHAIDLNLIDEEEEGARHGHAMDTNLITEEEEGARHGHAMDTNLMAEEEEQAREEEADAQVSRIRNLAKEQLDLGQEVNVSSNKKGNVGRKRKELDLARTATVSLSRRRTIRSLARCLGVPRSTLHDRFQLKELKRITNTVKPFLKPANKIARLKFCISMMDEHSISTPYPSFKSMNNMVHIDEKCIGKVTFLTAVAKPRYNDEGQMTFDGKIRTWAFVGETEAQRSSHNRDRGTIEVKSVKGVEEEFENYEAHKLFKSFITLQAVMVIPKEKTSPLKAKERQELPAALDNYLHWLNEMSNSRLVLSMR
ncbi:hypothetical protein D1007_50045 [Hordeum vulgare]|nr:hypothetical protein D1007_50045 [Hordeum vulgare]